MKTKTVLIIIIFVYSLLFDISSYGLKINSTASCIDKGSLWARVDKIVYNNDSIVALEADFNGEPVRIESRWTKKEIKNFAPIDTIVEGRTYLFYVIRISGSLTTPSKSGHVFQAYNMVEDKIIPLWQCPETFDMLRALKDGPTILQGLVE